MPESPGPSLSANPKQLLGKIVLVGMTIQSAEGEFLRREQFGGAVVAVDPERGIELRVADEQIEWIPPAFDLLEPAPPGEYHLKSTGEVIEDPDYLATFIITEPTEE